MSQRDERFIWKKNDATISQCAYCKHYTGQLQCDAFHDRIPMEILTGEHDHRQPYPGDNGIRFEPIEEKDKRQ